MSSVPNSAAVYYQDKYWNDHPLCKEQLARLVSAGLNEKPVWCVEHFREVFLQNKPAAKALFLNCGNGWVEREFFDHGIVSSAVAFDYSPDLLAQAEDLRQGRDIEYFQADCNTLWFPDNTFDLVVNVAAMHHVQRIDRMNQVIARSLKPDGLFFNWDYVGPHRNQYGATAWSKMQEINACLPEGFQAEPFIHPDLDSMLVADPTEAIHSELSLECFDRYFYSLERKDVFGGIAYQIMHNNHELFVEGLDVAQDSVSFLLSCDELAGATQSAPLLFSYYVGRPKKKVVDSSNQQEIDIYVDQEIEREQDAARNGGKYYGT